MILGNGLFTFARFANSKKDTIIATWYDSDVESYQEITIETNLESALYRKLLETFTVDEISTMTDQRIKEYKASFENMVKDMAARYGLVYDPSKAQPSTVASIDHIFTPPEGDDGIDLLFNIKLKIFDLPEVSSSTNADLKKKLREASTPLEALYIAGKFLYE